jgi:anti-sigma B factor antagonist
VSELGRFEITENGKSDRGPDRGVHELSLSGEVDLATSPELRRALFDALDAGVHVFTLDMAAVELIDATGIGVLVSAANRARREGGRITLRSPSAAVRRVLDAVDLEGVIEVES